MKDNPREKESEALKNKPDVMAHACGSHYLGSRGKIIMVCGQSEQLAQQTRNEKD